MPRTYALKKRRQWRDKNKRMTDAVRLRGEGLSLRAIAAELVVDEATVRRDLARWERERPNVTPLRHSAAAFSPGGGESPHPDAAATGTVHPLRRSS